MVEKIAELDDELTHEILEGQEISVDELKACPAQGCIFANKAYPVFVALP
jgi:translation elongation factor EF-G